MKIKERLRLNTWFSLGAIVLMLFTLGWSFREVYRADRNVLLTDEMRKVATDRIFLRDDYLLNRNERAKDQWYAKTETLRALLESATERVTGTEDRARLQEARKNFDATFALFSAILEEHKRKENADRKKIVFDDAESRLISQILLKAYALNESIDVLHESSSRAVIRAHNREIFSIVLFIVGSVIAIVINSIFISRIVAKRITALHEGVEIIGAGNVDYRIDVVGDDELSDLARASNEMVTNMKATREFAESVINTVREPLIALDQDLRVVKVSRSFYDCFKVNPEETVGQLIYDLGNKQWDIPKLRELLETILPQKATFDDYEVEHEFSTIGRRIMLLNARQIQRASGKERIILLAIEDITERKRLEDLLAESEEQYRHIFETASDGIVLLEKREGNIIQANLAVEKMLGYSKEEYLGKKLKDIGISLDMSDFPAIMQALDKSGIINHDDVLVKTKSGQYLYTDIYMVDRARLVQCNIREVTERKLEEEKLRKSEEFTRNILQSVDEGFIVIDLEYRVIAANRAYLNFIDKPLEEVIGKHCYELIHHIDKPCCEDGTTVCPVTLTFKTGEHYSAIHTHYDNKGAPVYLEVKSYPLKDKSGKIVSAIEISNDITEKKKLEDQLRHAQKMEAVGTLAGGIAHDFNNILNVIMGFGTMVMDRIGDDQLSKEQMNEVLTAADRAATLTKKLLIFSRKQVVEVQPVNINELIVGLQKMLVRIIREDVDFKLDLADRPLMVMADAGQMEQVLINLASNARDAMPEGGCLTISTGTKEMDDEYVAAYGYGKPGTYALITVADTGQGMDENTKKNIFEPFFTTKGIGEGTGLGLAISYGIIKQHNGYIKAYSEIGRGTTFKIWLPVIEDTTEEKPKAEALAYPKGGTETILVAEDDASLRKLSGIVLESSGYNVITAEDGEDAITKFMENREKISLALIDMIMPKKNGKEVAETIRKVSPGTNILFASGYTMDIIKTKELTESGFDFLLKPILPRDLLKKVREVLDRNDREK